MAPLFQAIRPKLAAQDQDQEVKEAAISCTATAVASLGDVRGSEYLSQVKVLSSLLSGNKRGLQNLHTATCCAPTLYSWYASKVKDDWHILVSEDAEVGFI